MRTGFEILEVNFGLRLAGRRAFSQSTARWSYESTIKNLRLHKDSKVLCQGFTGKTVSRVPQTPNVKNTILIHAVGSACYRKNRLRSTSRRP